MNLNDLPEKTKCDILHKEKYNMFTILEAINTEFRQIILKILLTLIFISSVVQFIKNTRSSFFRISDLFV